MIDAGFGIAEFPCLEKLWTKESGWNHKASNSSSGAYGIPQSLPGSKMGSVAADWRTNPATQIKWGLGYIKGRYKTPCGAWTYFQNNGQLLTACRTAGQVERPPAPPSRVPLGRDVSGGRPLLLIAVVG